MPVPSWVCASVAPASSSGPSTMPRISSARARGACLIADLRNTSNAARLQLQRVWSHIGAPDVLLPAPVDVRAEDAVGDEVAHHLERAAADREHARVAHHPFERQRAAVAGGAVDLQRLARHLLRRLRGERLGLRRLQDVGEAVAGARGRAVDHEARGVDLDRHVRELPADALEVADGPAELLAHRRVGEGLLVRALGEPERDGGRAEALAVVGGHQLLEAVAGTDEEIVAGDLAALEVQLALGDSAQAHHEFAASDAEAGRVALDEDAADALRARAPAEAPVDQVEA